MVEREYSDEDRDARRAEEEMRSVRRAGLREDERDPEEPAGAPGSAGGGKNMSGLPAGGLAAGGLGGTNTPTGATDDEMDALTNAYGVGTEDISGADEVSGEPLYGGPSGGAVGGTPAEKRVRGGGVPPGQGIAPGSDTAGESTVGKDPYGRRQTEGSSEASPGVSDRDDASEERTP